MKTVLVIITQPNLTSIQVHESLSATMVLATFGCEVKVLLKDTAFSLLHADLTFNTQQHAFKLGSNMVDSFEFYDLSPIYIEEQHVSHAQVLDTSSELAFVQLNAAFIQQFDHVLYW